MDLNMRSTDVYEEIGGYVKPPIVPLPEIDNIDSLKYLGLKINKRSKQIVKSAMILSGFRSFQKKLPETIEHHLRTNNLRLPGLYMPAISASLALADDPRHLTALERAATLIFAVRNLYDDLIAGRLPQDKYRDQVLEMGQYPNVYATSIIIDGKNVRMFKSKVTTQITVIVARRFYILEIENYNDVEQIREALAAIIQNANNHKLEAHKHSPGILTAATNETQLSVFNRIKKIQVNADSLDVLKHSFFTLCLEIDNHPSSYADAAFVTHGTNFENRWFHSSLQLVVYGNSKAVAICNFTTYLDGNTMMRTVSEIQKRAALCSFATSDGMHKKSLPPARELHWNINERAIWKAYKDVQILRDNQQATFEITEIGSSYFAAHKTQSIPAFILALQLAVKRLTGKIIKIEQFLTMTKYRCMDLTTAVITTQEVEEFIKHLEGNDVQQAKAFELLMTAIQSQAEVARIARSQLKLGLIITFYLRSLKRAKAFYAKAVLFFAALIIRLTGSMKSIPGGEIIVSHPDIFPEVPVVGRPAIRLPYVKYFGLHYQIYSEKIVITMMPGLTWKIPNTEFIFVLRECLQKIQWVINNGSRNRLN